MSKLKLIIYSGLILLILIFIVFLYSYIKLNENAAIAEEAIVMIPKQVSVSQCINIMNSNGLLKPNWLFNIVANVYAKFFNAKIHSGAYRFHPHNTNLKLLYAIFSGKQIYTIKVTFPEGISIKDFASRLQKHIEIDSSEFVDLCHNEEYLKDYNIPAKSLEGYLMPNTYEFVWKQSPFEILKILLNTQNEIWEDKFAEKAAQSKKTRHEILTMASIIESEAVLAVERPRIAGVYYNRLKSGMLLQADPTVQYAIGSKRRVLYRDLEINNPYNTYKFKGLPPGPINSPSMNSIEAALEPEKNEFYYFVSTGDGSGHHNFAKNKEQHEVFVNNYRKNR